MAKNRQRTGNESRNASGDEMLTRVAREMLDGRALSDIAKAIGMTPEALREEIFAAHAAGEWQRIVRKA